MFKQNILTVKATVATVEQNITMLTANGAMMGREDQPHPLPSASASPKGEGELTHRLPAVLAGRFSLLGS
jgi:hypothetical protein